MDPRLLLLALPPLCMACAGSLEAARADGMAERRAAAVGTAPSQRCQDLDSLRTYLSGGATVALVLAGTSGLPLLLEEVRDSKGATIAVVGGIVTFTATGKGLTVVSDGTAETWARECSAQ